MIDRLESEIKLMASPAMFDDLRAHPLLAGLDETETLTTTYFDTSDGRLRRTGASLRVRRGEGRCEQTFKRPSPAGVAIRRQEASAAVSGERPEPTRFDPEVRSALDAMLAGGELQSQAAASVTRTTRQVRYGQSLIELAFDSGTIMAAGGEDSVCELELELLEGRFADCLALARALPLGPELFWSVATKASRCSALASAAPQPPQRAHPVALTVGMNVAQGFQAICWNGLEHLLANYPLVTARGDNEALHQCRIALRRIRVAIGLFRDALDGDEARRFQAELGAVGVAMGEARELHVLREALAAAGNAQHTRILAILAARRDTALAGVGALLSAAPFQQLLLEFARWVEEAQGWQAGGALPAFAAGALGRRRHKLHHRGTHLRAMSAERLHQLRMDAKKLRYGAEFFAALFGAKATVAAGRHAALLANLQDDLGLLRDLDARGAAGPALFADEPELALALVQGHGETRKTRRKLLRAASRLLTRERDTCAWWKMEEEMAHNQGGNHGARSHLERLQIGLSAMQREIIAEGRKLLIIIEGRDAAGKDGTIKRIVEHMSPRDTRVVALGIPSERDRKAWYFQRWCRHLPVSGEIVLFNRSWYNRAGVERVMGFCSEAEYEAFMENVVLFEQLLVHSGFTILKYYLDIAKGEQKRRLADRKRDPLKQWKTSPLDKKAVKNWEGYSLARNAMLARTHSVFAPWVVVKADDKPRAHAALIADLLARCASFDMPGEMLPDPSLAFVYDARAVENGWLTP